MIADAVLLGADSLLVGFAVAPAMRGLRARLGFALACGLADGLASGFAGAVSWSPLERLAILPAVFFAAYGVAVFALATRLSTRSAVPVYVLAPALAIDNLLYSSAGGSSALGLGVSAGCSPCWASAWVRSSRRGCRWRRSGAGSGWVSSSRPWLWWSPDVRLVDVPRGPAPHR